MHILIRQATHIFILSVCSMNYSKRASIRSTTVCWLPAGASARVLLACDTRPSSPSLLAAAAAGVEGLGGTAVDCGQLTTPQLHWQLRRLNQGLPWALQDYFTTLAGAFEQLVLGTQPLGQVSCGTLSVVHAWSSTPSICNCLNFSH